MAGDTVHVAVETAWGDELGRWTRVGATRPLAGEPRPINGYGRERFVYAPVSGLFTTTRALGSLVCAGEIVTRIEEEPLTAPLSGLLRGLTHDRVSVTTGTKVIEIDPRGINRSTEELASDRTCSRVR